MDAERSRLVTENLGLVEYVAGMLKKRLPMVEYDELVADGNLGLVKAARAFDPTRGVRFQTYAFQTIRGHIIDGLRRRDYLSRSQRDAAKEDRWTPPKLHHLDDVVARREDGSPLTVGDLAARRNERGPEYPVEQKAQVLRLLTGLRPHDRVLVELYYVENLRLREIGQIFGLGMAATSLRLKKIMAFLRERMGA